MWLFLDLFVEIVELQDQIHCNFHINMILLVAEIAARVDTLKNHLGGTAMAQARSFQDYVAHRFHNELSAAIEGFLAENTSKLNLSSFSVRSVDNAELSDIRVMHVYVDNLPDMKIAFDVLVEADIVI